MYRNICLAVLSITRNTGNLEDYFLKNSQRFFLFLFPLSYEEKPTLLITYHSGKTVLTERFFWYKGKNKILKIFFQYLYFIFIVLFRLPKGTFIITYQPLFCLLAEIYEKIKKVHLVFCIGDYFPLKRDFITRIYHWLTTYYAKRIQFTFFSPGLDKQYSLPPVKRGYLRQLLVYGIKRLKIKRRPQENLIGYIGHLRPGQGIELIFETMKHNTKLKFEVIGRGKLLEKYKKDAKIMNLSNRVRFYGFISNPKIPLITNRWLAGLAPYEIDKKSVTYYAEPSKPKLYLQLKLPVIMTRITYFYKIILKYKAGIIIDYETNNLIKSIADINKNPFQFEAGINKLTDLLEYQQYYRNKFRFMEINETKKNRLFTKKNSKYC